MKKSAVGRKMVMGTRGELVDAERSAAAYRAWATMRARGGKFGGGAMGVVKTVPAPTVLPKEASVLLNALRGIMDPKTPSGKKVSKAKGNLTLIFADKVIVNK